MEDFSEIKIKPLTRKAINKLKKGGTIRVTEGDFPVRINKAKVTALMKKLSKGKGSNMSMDASEIEMNGEGLFKSISKGVKAMAKSATKGAKKLVYKAGDYLKSEQFQKDLVNVARPTLKGAVEGGIGTLAASAIASNPELAPVIIPAAYVASYGANKIIDKPSIITGNTKFDKGGMLLKPRMPRIPKIAKIPPIGSDPLSRKPLNLKDMDEWVRRGQGIYTGQQHVGEGIFASGGALGEKMMGGRGELRQVLESPNPFHTQHFNQNLKQFM
jgi:hypothetical protein